ncbi:mediator of RNA polymerase II transcription subunit 27 [Nilaparvata lugens]|uniref:mediator of RNA polymerase II transcription subunit 27 n=1 Tax=Nilaparvata lugens TaxID=108931 RepID=UPI000B97CD92|nr:mediator of RNA polymerase II transcription subunit 27 [Nilaparvata lugens]XP_039285982.1 mediator of RNA polymerase II transcription subunit 27 [Nilaparvata lugens]XP_039285983.1 mediator of RNA polymerase II transcription subunit 27 [Nilaparvata lugens]
MNIDQLYRAMSSIKILRCSVGEVFSTLANGLCADHGEEGKETKFLLEIQELLSSATQHLRDVEQAVGALSAPPGPFNLGNSAFLSQESTQDRQQLYSQLVLTYKWTDKIHEYSNMAVSLMTQNSLKRSNTNSSTAKRKKTQTSSHNVPPQTVDNVINSIDRLFPDMNLSFTRPFHTNVVLQVSLGHILQAAVAFRGLMIEWVVVKGYGESLDLWTESRHNVFRKLTENAHAAMLHFYSPTLPDLAVRSFMTWLRSYNSLFNDPCKRCNNHLQSGLPPTWRDLRTLQPYHEECKP